jgi:hypothetical protein
MRGRPVTGAAVFASKKAIHTIYIIFCEQYGGWYSMPTENWNLRSETEPD